MKTIQLLKTFLKNSRNQNVKFLDLMYQVGKEYIESGFNPDSMNVLKAGMSDTPYATQCESFLKLVCVNQFDKETGTFSENLVKVKYRGMPKSEYVTQNFEEIYLEWQGANAAPTQEKKTRSDYDRVVDSLATVQKTAAKLDNAEKMKLYLLLQQMAADLN
jgi:hypothetical protein